MLLLPAFPSMADEPVGARDRATILSNESKAGRAAQDQYGYSEAVLIDGTLYMSGVVVGLGPEGDTPEAAFERAFEHIGSILHRAGMSWRDVVDITSFHTDLTTQIDVMAKVKARYVTPRFPSWTAVEVSRLLPEKGLTEIKIVARATPPVGNAK
jgi:enamine deaminase RidA (YjgF/YER057c/UK114 family)